MFFVAIGALTTPGTAAAQSPATPRGRLAAALESLIADGPRGHTTHDDGEWLQLAVTDAIRRGDTAIERLAVRAASPLTARIICPVSSVETGTVEIAAQTLLTVPHPIRYTAQIFASADGAEFVDVGEVRSGKSQSLRISTKLGSAAGAAGYHSLRIRAQLAFGPAGSDGSWTEARDLPRLFYAVYDTATGVSSMETRALVEGPAGVAVHEFDAALGDEPFGVWLKHLLSSRAGRDDVADFYARSRSCSERTGEPGILPDPKAVCAVVDFQLRHQIGQIWFRTADVRITDAGATWQRTTPPRFEGFVINGSAPESSRLSFLPALLDTDPSFRPLGDVLIDPNDIVISPVSPKPGEPTLVKVTVRNQGSGDLFKVSVHVAWGALEDVRGGGTRMFVVDLPAQARQMSNSRPCFHWDTVSSQ